MKNETAKLLSDLVQNMVDTLVYVSEYDADELIVNEQRNISDDLDYVQVNFFRTPPDGDHQHKVRTELGISAMEAIHILSTRINNTFRTII